MMSFFFEVLCDFDLISICAKFTKLRVARNITNRETERAKERGRQIDRQIKRTFYANLAYNNCYQSVYLPAYVFLLSLSLSYLYFCCDTKRRHLANKSRCGALINKLAKLCVLAARNCLQHLAFGHTQW